MRSSRSGSSSHPARRPSIPVAGATDPPGRLFGNRVVDDAVRDLSRDRPLAVRVVAEGPGASAIRSLLAAPLRFPSHAPRKRRMQRGHLGLLRVADPGLVLLAPIFSRRSSCSRAAWRPHETSRSDPPTTSFAGSTVGHDGAKPGSCAARSDRLRRALSQASLTPAKDARREGQADRDRQRERPQVRQQHEPALRRPTRRAGARLRATWAARLPISAHGRGNDESGTNMPETPIIG